MTHFADLAPCWYFNRDFQHGLKAVGWLHQDHPYVRGPASDEFVVALQILLRSAWQYCGFLGIHQCEFCRISRGPQIVRCWDTGIDIGVGLSNLFVPGDGFLYVAPSMIIHYIDAHEYAPPDEFQAAVLRCPPMRSAEYFERLVQNSPPGFLEEGEELK